MGAFHCQSSKHENGQKMKGQGEKLKRQIHVKLTTSQVSSWAKSCVVVALGNNWVRPFSKLFSLSVMG